MEKGEKFEDLRIWPQSRKLVSRIYNSFGVGSPSERDFGFRDQVQRAAISILNNIAEGYERVGDTEFARFLSLSKGSRGEVRSMMYVAEDLEYLTTESDCRSNAVSVTRGIWACYERRRIWSCSILTCLLLIVSSPETTVTPQIRRFLLGYRR